MKSQFLVLWQPCGLQNISIVIKGPWQGLELVGRNSLTNANISKSKNMVKFGKSIKDETRKCKRTYTLKSTYKKLCLFKRLSFSQKMPKVMHTHPDMSSSRHGAKLKFIQRKSLATSWPFAMSRTESHECVIYITVTTNYKTFFDVLKIKYDVTNQLF